MAIAKVARLRSAEMSTEALNITGDRRRGVSRICPTRH
jgi:hypothetical protein